MAPRDARCGVLDARATGDGGRIDRGARSVPRVWCVMVAARPALWILFGCGGPGEAAGAGVWDVVDGAYPLEHTNAHAHPVNERARSMARGPLCVMRRTAGGRRRQPSIGCHAAGPAGRAHRPKRGRATLHSTTQSIHAPHPHVHPQPGRLDVMSTSRLLALIRGRGGGGGGGDELMAVLAGLEELNMHLTMGTGGPMRLGEICSALVTLLGGQKAAVSSEIVRVGFTLQKRGTLPSPLIDSTPSRRPPQHPNRPSRRSAP